MGQARLPVAHERTARTPQLLFYDPLLSGILVSVRQHQDHVSTTR